LSQEEIMMKRALLVCLFASAAQAGLVRLEVKERSDVLDGKSFGSTGAYERIIGRAYFAIDPQLAANHAITDIALAPTNKDGMVEFSCDMFMLRPRDPAKGNGTVLYEVANRSAKRLLQTFNLASDSRDPRKPEEFGDGLLMERGYTLLWLGWQFDLPPNGDLRLYPPAAEGVKGIVRAEMTPEAQVTSMSLGDRNHRPYPVLNPDDPNLKLTVRDTVEGARTTLDRASWHIEKASSLVIPRGFEPGRLYELVYTAENPPIAGTGFAVVRDFISWMKYGGGVSGAPAPGAVYQRAIGLGISQSGRYLRTMLYYGFNADEKNRKVFDGMLPVVAAAGRGVFNMRFAQPSRDSSPFTNTLTATDLFPFNDLDATDPVTGKKDGLLTHSLTPELRPKIFYLNSSHEYYGRSLALLHTSADGRADAPLAPDSRYYFFAGGQHAVAAFPPKRGGTQYLPSPTPYTLTFRALLDAMAAWIRDGKQPPASRYPTLAKNELAPLAKLKFPAIPGVALPRYPHLAYPSDYGPEFLSKGIAAMEPPKIGKPYPMLAPRVDADGNDVSGVRMPEVQAPLATYIGWNFRAAETGAPDQMFSLVGGMIPFARTKAERMASNDPRPSIEERYPSKDDYLARFETAAKQLVSDGFLLPEDVAPLVKRGAAEWDYIQSGSH
jgi:hypothetical protein